jgi:predicted metal-dependent enzyme (double-stranded beta helix superfamily)
MPAALVESIQRAVKEDRVTSLAAAVAALHERGTFEDEDFFLAPRAEHYARRLIWSDPKQRFVLVAMTWAPGQTTPLHDHDGLWGVEIVISGIMKETAYRLVERDAAGRHCFVRERERVSSKGTAGVLCPPVDYHTFGNVGTTPARTLHVYGGAMARCNVFRASGDGWWESETVQLGYDG